MRRVKEDKSPAFQLYTKDLLSDANVLAMELDEFGAYMKLMAICWNEKGLPDEPDRLGRMIGITRDRFDGLWPTIARCFYLFEGQWQHKRLDKERKKQAKFRQQRKLAARSRWKKERCDRITDASLPQSSAFASASAIADQDQNKPTQKSRRDSSLVENLSKSRKSWAS